ncbi:MAG: DUF3108 domain-containing protein [Candidatus Polarisedimenticolaceae bacterium]|nr:DUF3108 domain-containing protein [Candidatus Polarisedimenticolaceae bacterium]
MMKISTLKYWLSASLFLLVAQTGAEPTEVEIRPFQASYQLSRNGLPFGHTEVTFQLDQQGQYRYSAETRPNALTALLHDQTIIESSQGELSPEGLTPNRYDYRKEKSGQTHTTQINFDWPHKRVTTNTNGTPWSMPVPLATQDKLSQQLAIQVALLQGKDSVSFDVADGGHLKRYHYKRERLEKLVTPLGNITTVRVKRSKQSTHDYTIWFAPSLNYLPVRFERKQPNGRFVMRLVSTQQSAISTTPLRINLGVN